MKIKPFRNGFLRWEPTRRGNEPIIDEITAGIAKLYGDNISGGLCKDHTPSRMKCKCGAESTGSLFLLPGVGVVDSLCVHRVACHRKEVTSEEMKLLKKIATDKMIYIPHYMIWYRKGNPKDKYYMPGKEPVDYEKVSKENQTGKKFSLKDWL